MLEPDVRALLYDLLQPPPGFTLAHAVGTTFTLNLESALTVPLAFAGSRANADDAVGVLDALRRAADRVDIFAQAGCVSLPKMHDLVALLEPMVHPVGMRGRLFHPKVWFLEFEADGERSYRFVCGSRNLTTDQTWDAVVSIDGRPSANVDTMTARSNDAMSALLRWLPRHLVQPMPDARRKRIDDLADHWQSIAWEPPADTRALEVHVLGIGRDTIELPQQRQSLIVSPFITSDALERLRARPGGATHVVARPEQLDRLDPTALQNGRLSLKVLDETADPSVTHDGVDLGLGILSGLHAKLVVHDGPHMSRLLIGSANATDAAWTSNVEVMLDIVGSTARIGVDATLNSLAPILESYATTGGADAPPDEEARWRLESALRDLATAEVSIAILTGEPYAFELWREDPSSDELGGFDETNAEVTVRWHLATRPDLAGTTLPRRDNAFRSGSIALHEITPFVVLTASDAQGHRASSILVARLIDDVADRRDAIVARQLIDPRSFAKFLQLLLQAGGTVPLLEPSAAGAWSAFGGSVAEDGSGLLELLVRSTGADHDGLEVIDRVLRQLSAEERGRALPTGFLEVWSAVAEARRLDHGNPQ